MNQHHLINMLEFTNTVKSFHSAKKFNNVKFSSKFSEFKKNTKKKLLKYKKYSNFSEF